MLTFLPRKWTVFFHSSLVHKCDSRFIHIVVSLYIVNGLGSNFSSPLQESIHRRSDDNSLQRSQKLPIILRIKTSGEVYNYGPQTLNSADLAREQLRQILSKVSRKLQVLCLETYTQLVQLFNNLLYVKFSTPVIHSHT